MVERYSGAMVTGVAGGAKENGCRSVVADAAPSGEAAAATVRPVPQPRRAAAVFRGNRIRRLAGGGAASSRSHGRGWIAVDAASRPSTACCTWSSDTGVPGCCAPRPRLSGGSFVSDVCEDYAARW